MVAGVDSVTLFLLMKTSPKLLTSSQTDGWTRDLDTGVQRTIGYCVGYDTLIYDEDGEVVGSETIQVDGAADALPPFANFASMARTTAEQTGRRRCTRAIWGDGTVDGVRFDLCSKCWHCWAAFHSGYRLMQANPAASQIDDVGLERLFVGRKMDGEQGCEKCQCGRRVPDESIVCSEDDCVHRPYMADEPQIDYPETLMDEWEQED